MRIWIYAAAICLVTLSAAHAADDDLSETENQAINSMMACYQAHKIHELAGRMDENNFVRTVMGEICTEQRQQAAATLEGALAAKGLSQNEIQQRVDSFLLGHTTTLRMFYRRIKGAQ
jgi:hypothetical protein